MGLNIGNLLNKNARQNSKRGLENLQIKSLPLSLIFSVLPPVSFFLLYFIFLLIFSSLTSLCFSPRVVLSSFLSFFLSFNPNMRTLLLLFFQHFLHSRNFSLSLSLFKLSFFLSFFLLFFLSHAPFLKKILPPFLSFQVVTPAVISFYFCLK